MAKTAAAGPRGRTAKGKPPPLDEAIMGASSRGKQRRLVTPEGVPITVQLGERGERFTAALIDYVIIHGVLFGIALLWPLSGYSGGAWMASLLMLSSFLLRNFYFTFFELRWDGRTPGKRKMGLKVIDAQGGPLRSDSVIVRNLTREVEINLPLSVVFSGLAGGSLGLFVAIGWAVVFALMPLFNRNNLRIGDMIAGTWVIAAPKPALLPDLVQERSAPAPGGKGATADAHPAIVEDGLTFSDAQLGVYGIYELQVLEEVLRRKGPKAEEARKAVSDRIKAKIAWDEAAAPRHSPTAFLNAFYTALRRNLETRMLFGQRREHKQEGSLRDTTSAGPDQPGIVPPRTGFTPSPPPPGRAPGRSRTPHAGGRDSADGER